MSSHDKLMISVAGVRGVVGTSLTPAVALRFAAAFGSYAGRGRVVVGRDSRLSGPVIEQAVEAGLRSVGCGVVRIGVVPTPTVQLTTRMLKARGGIAITASHNPPQWNALKFVSARGLFLTKPQGGEVLDRYRRGAFRHADYAHQGPAIDLPGAAAAHVAAILKLPFLDLAAIRRRRFTVVTDTCHGAGGPIFGLLLRELGCRVVALHAEPTGMFSRPIEPLAKNLAELERAVRQHHADVGFATDADVDRLSIVSERGRALGEEYSLALAADFMLSRRRGTAVTNLSTSRMIDEVAARRGGTVVRTPVGEANVVAGMMRRRAVIGGEGNGGIIIPGLNHARDATAGIALILQLLADEGRPISAIAAALPAYRMIKGTIAVERPARLLAAVARHFCGATVDRRDGIKAVLPGAWVHVRASGTEPIVRVIAEAATAAGARKLVNTVKGLR